MAKNVYIKIKSIQTANGENEETELFTCGKLTKLRSGGGYRVVYEESEAMGFEGCSVSLDISDSLVKMARSGNANSTLYIEKGKKHHGHYGTPYGDIMVGINTDEIKNEITDCGGDLYMRYTIDVNSSFLSMNELFINIKENNTAADSRM